ncbi:RICIN domain-containing protein [Mycobacterium botniense]|uniref:Ricin B lectin domain-containing protein n=1 Tax=Mycobacterium botniense TaxID=84962 RepID=A0A7I9XSF3_9MYCO|nr:RICIN domain-containing protein [Mycobacterium botniense]GFG72925.1 hypothetical protein MBOT_02900 [Mycobacterium botniense]
MRDARLTGGLRTAGVALGAVVGVGLVSAGVAGAADPVQVKSRLGNWCLDTPNGSSTAAVVNPCDGSRSQLWVVGPAGQAGGQIESVAFPGNCLSISNSADNTPVLLAACRVNATTEQWNFQPDGQITSALGPCLNVFGGVAQPGTAVIAYHCIPGVADEQWESVAG